MSSDTGLLSVRCPCCQAELMVDSQTGSVMLRKPPVRPAPISDLASEVARLRTAEAAREEAFQRSLAAERGREARNERTFEELLKKAREDASSDTGDKGDH